MEVRQVRDDEVKLIKVDMPEVNIRYTGKSDSIRADDSTAVWQIRREYKNGDVVESTYANMGSFNCTWTDRETYFSSATPDPLNPLDVVYATVTTGLPAGASTEAKQDVGNASLASIDTKLTAPISVSQSGNWDVRNITGSVSLPTGAATSALQTTGNTSLSSIDGKTPALGQALAASSVPVVLTAAQITTLTPLSTVAVTQSTSPWVVSLASTTITGTVAATQSGTWNITDISGTVSLPTGAATSALQTTGNTSMSSIDGKLGSLGQKAMAGSAPVVIASDQSAIPATQSGTWTVQPGNTANTTAWKVDGSAVTQPVSGIVSSKTALTPSSPTAATVGVTTALAVASNANRKGLACTNTSVNTISLGLGVAAVLNSGITLYPGGVWVMDEYTFTTGAINAIASAASSNLAIQEFTT